jgi:alpha-beta hydrolase superfamily lysophospholipase
VTLAPVAPAGAFFLGGPHGRALFCWYDPPVGTGCRGGVVLCNPIGDDAVRAHRPLRHLAQRLARAGFAVLRFDFDGTGDSSGDERLPDRVESWLTDVRLVVAELRARSGAAAIAVVGLRLGGTLATIAAAAAGVDTLVLWGSYARGGAYVSASTQFFKLHKKIEPRSFAGGPPSRGDGEEAFGFLLTHETIAGLKALDVRSSTGPGSPPRRALLVGDGSGRAEQDMLEEHLRAIGATAERRVFPGCLQFLVEIPHKSRLPDEAIDGIVAWLSEVYPATDAPALPAGSSSALFGEEPIVFGRRHPVFGIHHPPGAHPGRELPPIVLASAGTVHRIGPHRFYVTLARRWAGLGFSVLRVDLSGIGDSPAACGVENVTYPRDGYDDLGEAMDLLTERTGARRFILAGLCSGGDFAFQMGMRDPRVVGSVIMNPRTFCVNDLAAVETGNFESVLAAASRVSGGRAEAPPVPESLRRMVERGVDTLLVVTDEDPGVHYVDVHWGDAMRALAELPGFRREDIAGTDHNFTSLWSQERVSDLVTEHLTRRFLS